MTIENNEIGWERLDSLDDIEVDIEGMALIVIGMDRCESCDVVAEQVRSFVINNEKSSSRFYKFSTHGKSKDELSLLGQELRFFPTVLGFMNGSVAFKHQGAFENSSRSDTGRLERGFARFVENQR